MVLAQFDAMRFFQIYVIQGFIGFFFLFLAWRIIQRGRKGLNRNLSIFYILSGVGVILNIVYASLSVEGLEPLVLGIHFITNYLVAFSIIFLVIFELILFKTSQVFSKKRELRLVLMYACILAGSAIFLFFENWGIKINVSTDWKPVWYLPYFIYMLVVGTIGGTIPLFYYAFIIYRDIKDENIKRKWTYYIIGSSFLITFQYGVYIANYLDIAIFRTVWLIIAVFLILIGSSLIYYGIGRQIDKKNKKTL